MTAPEYTKREINVQVARIEKELRIKNGDLESEEGKPSGGTKIYTREGIAALSPEQYAKESDDIAAASSAGNIK